MSTTLEKAAAPKRRRLPAARTLAGRCLHGLGLVLCVLPGPTEAAACLLPLAAAVTPKCRRLPAVRAPVGQRSARESGRCTGVRLQGGHTRGGGALHVGCRLVSSVVSGIVWQHALTTHVEAGDCCEPPRYRQREPGIAAQWVQQQPGLNLHKRSQAGDTCSEVRLCRVAACNLLASSHLVEPCA